MRGLRIAEPECPDRLQQKRCQKIVGCTPHMGAYVQAMPTGKSTQSFEACKDVAAGEDLEPRQVDASCPGPERQCLTE